MTQFGPLVSASQVEEAVLDTLKEWLHTYLGNTERVVGRPVGSMLRPRSYSKTAGNPLAIQVRELPRVVVQSPGLVSEPESTGSTLTLAWGCTVWMYAKGIDAQDTQDICRDNASAIRLLMLQKIPDLIDYVDLLDENYDAVPPERENTTAGCELVFALRVADAADIGTGPADPDPPQDPVPPIDYGDWPEVDETDVEIIHVAADEEVSP